MDSGVGSFLSRAERILAAPMPTPVAAPKTMQNLPSELVVPKSGNNEVGGLDGVVVSREVGASEGQLVSTLESLICSYSWSCEEALSIVYGPTPACPTGESNGNPRATNGISWGLFAIHRETWEPVFTDMFVNDNWADPEWNTAHAFRIWSIRENFSAWSCN